jgi:hypothetical protein
MNVPACAEIVEADCGCELEKLETRLRACLCGRVRDLQVLWQESGIVLRGFASTYYAKQLAQHAVMRATNLPVRANQIEVR